MTLKLHNSLAFHNTEVQVIRSVNNYFPMAYHEHYDWTNHKFISMYKNNIYKLHFDSSYAFLVWKLQKTNRFLYVLTTFRITIVIPQCRWVNLNQIKSTPLFNLTDIWLTLHVYIYSYKYEVSPKRYVWCVIFTAF